MAMSGDPSSPNLPTPEEREMYLKKIREWRTLGFDTGNLEELLDSDFQEFKRRRLQILKSQVGTKEELLAEARGAASAPAPAPSTPGPAPVSPPSQPEKALEEPDIKESLLLVGEPIELEEPEVEVKKIDNGVIHVGKPSKLPTRKARLKREAERELEAAGEVPIEVEGIKTGKGQEFKIMDLKEGDTELRDEEEEEEEAPARRKKRPRAKESADSSKKVKAILIVAIVIISGFLYYYSTIKNGENDNGTPNDIEELVPKITVQPAYTDYSAGEIITFDAIDSEGDIQEYDWDIDNDFKLKSGSLTERKITGYFSPNEHMEKNYTVTLTIRDKYDNEQRASKPITVSPLTVELASEKLNDYGEYEVTGFFNLENPEGIIKFNADISDLEVSILIREVHIDFRTAPTDPMTTILKDAPNIEDGFWQIHDTYKREIEQNLDLSGEVKGTASHPIFPNPYEFTANLDGKMDSRDESYTDYTTLNTIKTYVENDINLTVSIDIPWIDSEDFDMASHNEMRSYPDLRNKPMRFSIEDLSDDPIELGHTDAIKYGNIIYIWKAESVDFVYNIPAMKLNLTLDSETISRNDTPDEFFMNVWVADGVSLPVGTYIYAKSTIEGNTTTVVHKAIMTDYSEGSVEIGYNTCSNPGTGSGHFYDNVSAQEYENDTVWRYLPSKGHGTNSFNTFPPEQAIQYVEADTGFNGFRTSHPNLYVVRGYCSGIGDGGPQELFWNLTFSEKGSNEGYNIIVDKSGVRESEMIDIDTPPNSTSEFEPVLTFAGSEQILANLSDTEIDKNIFNSQGKIDFTNVSYGVRANVAYPTIDITSVSMTDRSKYTFYIENPGKGYTVALDAETGQILFTRISTSSGYEFIP